MINAEKYRKEILETIDGFENYGVTERNQIIMCEENGCCICQFCKDLSCDNKAKIRWLLSEYKEPIKLSRFEYDILKYLYYNTRHMYIARSKSGNLFIFDVEPGKNNINSQWNGRGMCGMQMFNKLFRFIQWEDEQPTSFKDVLDNCEVVDDDNES